MCYSATVLPLSVSIQAYVLQGFTELKSRAQIVLSTPNQTQDKLRARQILSFLTQGEHKLFGRQDGSYTREKIMA